MPGANDYYVYVYIDPRNFDEFYYGKGKGLRKNAHLRKLQDLKESKMLQLINQIREEGLEPLVRVIAKDLTAREALLIEKTLLWKLGKYTTNIATGHFSKNFRPANTLFKEVFGFDYTNGIYYFNVGENSARNWDDCRRYGFISAGWGERYRDAMKSFHIGDLVAPYLKGHGFVGVGRIQSVAQMIGDVMIKDQKLLTLPLTSEVPDHDLNDASLCEYVCTVKWIKSVPREKAKWCSEEELFTNPTVRASLNGQEKTLRFIEREFGITLSSYLK